MSLLRSLFSRSRLAILDSRVLRSSCAEKYRPGDTNLWVTIAISMLSAKVLDFANIILCRHCGVFSVMSAVNTGLFRLMKYTPAMPYCLLSFSFHNKNTEIHANITWIYAYYLQNSLPSLPIANASRVSLIASLMTV